MVLEAAVVLPRDCLHKQGRYLLKETRHFFTPAGFKVLDLVLQLVDLGFQVSCFNLEFRDRTALFPAALLEFVALVTHEL